VLIRKKAGENEGKDRKYTVEMIDRDNGEKAGRGISPYKEINI